MRTTIADVQRHFLTPLTQQETAHYQARLIIAQGVDWKHGAFYAIGDADERPGRYAIFKCHIENDEVYLGEENACDEIGEYKPVYFVVYQGCRIIPQR